MPGRRSSLALLVAGALGLAAVLGLVVPAAAIVPYAALWAVPFAGMYVAGAIASRLRPDDLAAHRLLLLGAVSIVWTAGNCGLLLAYDRWGEGDWLPAANTLQQILDLALPAAILALLAVYPDGLYQRRYERRLVRGTYALAVAVPLGLLLSQPALEPAAMLQWAEGAVSPPTVESPLHVGWLDWLASPLAGYTTAVLAIVPTLGVGLLVLRYRRLEPEPRLQIRWPLYGALLMGATAAFDPLVNAGVLPLLAADSIEAGSLLLLPISLAIGLVRPELFDLEFALRRSVVYVLLWLAIGASYVGLAAALGVTAGGDNLQVAIAVTIAATLLFQPARRALAGRARRLAYGESVSGEELLRRLGAALEHTLDLDRLTATLAATIREGLGVRWVRITVSGLPEALAGVVGGRAAVSVQLVDGDDQVGTIECGPKAHGLLGADDRALLATLGQQAGLALRNARLASELEQRLGQIRGQASELAASRTRIVEAEESARRRIERDLHDGVQQELVALIARIGLARNQLPRDPTLLEGTLTDLQSEAQQALADLRDFASGIHPSVLGDLGLLGAIEGRAARLPMGVTIESEAALRETRFTEVVEGAAYFFVCEGFANALKHSRGERVTVRLALEAGDVLAIELSDDGRGFDPASSARSGLSGLADRLEALGGSLRVTSNPGRGTTLAARLPARERALA